MVSQNVMWMLKAVLNVAWLLICLLCMHHLEHTECRDRFRLCIVIHAKSFVHSVALPGMYVLPFSVSERDLWVSNGWQTTNSDIIKCFLGYLFYMVSSLELSCSFLLFNNLFLLSKFKLVHWLPFYFTDDSASWPVCQFPHSCNHAQLPTSNSQGHLLSLYQAVAFATQAWFFSEKNLWSVM